MTNARDETQRGRDHGGISAGLTKILCNCLLVAFDLPGSIVSQHQHTLNQAGEQSTAAFSSQKCRSATLVGVQLATPAWALDWRSIIGSQQVSAGPPQAAAGIVSGHQAGRIAYPHDHRTTFLRSPDCAG